MKKILTIAILVFAMANLKAQYVRPSGDNPASTSTPQSTPQANDFWSHVSIGGSLGLQFGSETFIGLSPLMNYHVNENVEIGVGPIYQYFSYTDPYYGTTYSTSLYGGRITALCFLPGKLQQVFIQGEYQLLNVPDDYSPVAGVTRATVGIPLIGGGIRRPIGEHSYFIISALWDLSNSPLSPYYYMWKPIITGGVDLGI